MSFPVTFIIPGDPLTYWVFQKSIEVCQEVFVKAIKIYQDIDGVGEDY